MSATKKLLNRLIAGQRVGTDNKTCASLGTNQVPDLVRKLRNKGINVSSLSKRIKKRERTVRCVEYYLTSSEIQRLTNTEAA